MHECRYEQRNRNRGPTVIVIRLRGWSRLSLIGWVSGLVFRYPATAIRIPNAAERGPNGRTDGLEAAGHHGVIGCRRCSERKPIEAAQRL